MAMDFSDAVNDHVKGAIAQLYTNIPAIITSVANLESDNVVSVQPAINKTSGDGFSYPMAEIPDVPVQWPAGGGAVLTFPLAVGDEVWLSCSMTSMSEWWLTNSGTVTPFDSRMHDLSDCVAIPSIFRKGNNPAPSKDDVVLKYGGHSITLEKSGGNIVINTSADTIINCTTATINGNLYVDGTIEASGNISSDAEVTANAASVPIGLSTHIHPYLNVTTPSLTDAPQSPP